MPANLPPTYHEAEDRYRTADSVEGKIAALEEMLRIMPKHKGTDKLQADLRSRIAKLRKQPKKKGATRAASVLVAREGAGQVALVGEPNTGKSSLVARLTHAKPEVAEYPFTTRVAMPGMMQFEDVQIELVDLPPLSDEYVEPWVFDQIRRADLVWIVVDSENGLDELERVLAMLEGKKIDLRRAGVSPEPEGGRTVKPALLVVTGRDLEGSRQNVEILVALLDESWPLEHVSTVSEQGLDELRRATFTAMNVMRVYTKQPGKPADKDTPFTLPHGSTIDDLARMIHKEMSEGLKFARVWGTDVFDGQTVQRDHVLHDGDVVELHV